jgi:thiosulfate/3-mercaptopyruvate sulfurtransferase
MSDLLIQADELKARLQRPGCLIFDVRHDLAKPEAGREAYQQGHIPHALYLDHEMQLCAPCTGQNGRHPLPDRADFAALMRAQGLTARSDVVVYDAGNSMFAAHLWWMLRWLGHESVAVLDGGWAAWLAADGPVESGLHEASISEAQALQGLVQTRQPSMPTVDARAVLGNLDEPRFTVLDARAPERFSGQVEPIDPVGGHIPGALNRPFVQNVQADGRFKPASQLRAEFESLLGDRLDRGIVHQCGSGITACHNLFAMELAGFRGSALYPGSWSEWCSNPDRPVARGAAPNGPQGARADSQRPSIALQNLDIEILRSTCEAKQVAHWIYQEWARFETDAVWQKNRQDLDRSLNEALSIPKFFVARQAGQLIGMASIVENDLPSHPELHPWLANVYVSPEWRSRGVGSRLIRRAMDWSSTLVSTIYLYTTSQVELYLHLGWEILREDLYNDRRITLMCCRAAAMTKDRTV